MLDSLIPNYTQQTMKKGLVMGGLWHEFIHNK